MRTNLLHSSAKNQPLRIFPEFNELMELVSHRIDEQCRQVLEHKLAGFNNREIAKDLEVTERTVGRRLVIIRNVLNELINDS